LLTITTEKQNYFLYNNQTTHIHHGFVRIGNGIVVWEEGNLRFEFSARWQVVKLDQHVQYRQGIEKLDGTKAVDFVGLFDQRDLYFIEVKDFRGHRIENKQRLRSGELAIEMGQKVRDSLACLVAGCRATTNENLWQPLAQRVVRKDTLIRVVLWLEQDLPAQQLQRSQKAQDVIFLKQVKAKVGWLTNRVAVVALNTITNQLPDVQIYNLPTQKL
jgi:hypothetical protein